MLENYPGLSRNNIKHLLTNQQVLVNGAAVRQFDFLLVKDDIISISPYKVRKDGKRISKLKILYEDDELIAINKPHGLLSIATDNEKEITAYRIMMDYVRETNPRNRVFVLHRLDKETSGVLVFAKNEQIRDKMQKNWNDIVKKREYIAVCEGVFDKKDGTIISYLLPTKTNLMYSSHRPNDGQKAITHYHVEAENDEYSLLRVNIDTGRKNQIRVHMSDLGHKVIGDDKYGSTINPINRMGLHASVFEFNHPISNKHFKFIASTPKEFFELFNLKKSK